MFQEFDAQAEQTSLAILSRLGRFSGSASFSKDAVIDVVLNEGLRSRIGRGHPDEEEIELVRDAYLVQVQRQLEQDRAENERLNEQLRNQETELTMLRSEREVTTEEARTIRDKLESERVRLDERERDMSDLKDSYSELESELEQARRASEGRKALASYVSMTVFCIMVSGFFGWLTPKVFPRFYQELGSAIAFSLSVIVAWFILQTMAEFLTKSRLRYDQLKEYRLVRGFRQRIGRVIFALFLGVIASIIGSMLL